MMPRKFSKILTAYVDGELSVRQRKAVRRYLRRSPRARKLYRMMKSDAQALRTIQWPTLNRDLSDTIIDQIKTRHEFQLPAAGLQRRWVSALPRWTAAAAAVLFAVGIGSYLYFANPGNSPVPVAVQPATSDATAVEPIPHALGRPDVEPIVPDLWRRPSDENVFAFPNLKVPQVKLAQVQLPSIFQVSDLQRPAEAEQLKKEFRKEGAYRLDLFTHGSAKGLERLQAACKSEGIEVCIDPAGQEFVSRGMDRTWALYVENIRPEEAIRLLARLSADDKKLGHFQTAVLTTTSAEDLASVLGGTGKELAPPSQRPVDQGTAGEIISTLPGESGKARAPRMIVVPHEPTRETPYDEVKNLLEGNRVARPGTVQLLLVVWGPEQP